MKASPELLTAQDGTLADRLARAITLAGPISVASFMAAANARYYAHRDPMGSAGDFITAPEISQMFGELIGAWATDLIARAGAGDAIWVELGPGRGTLTADALRVLRKAGLNPPVHFVETSPVLRRAQAARVPGAAWHDGVDTVPDDRPMIVVANEFFDALPIRQLVRAGDGWHERLVACQDTLFLPIMGKPVPGDILPPEMRDAPPGSIIETAPQSVAIVRALTGRVVAQGGAVLIIDYGYDGPAIGDTLQAVNRHRFANPFDCPGDQDLSAHVDFATLAAAAVTAGGRAHGPVPQGDFLTAIGIDARTAVLGQGSNGGRVHADRARLIAADQMGRLFRVLAIAAPDWPEPEGFR